MNFILKMAWRDSRASRRRLVLFSFSVVLGIAALVAIGSLGANLERGIDEQAKGLLGADLIITGRSPVSDAVQRHVDALGAEQAREISFSSMMVFPSADNLTRLVNVRATEGAFPFYGEFVTVPEDAPAKLRAGGDIAIVEETLLRQFDTKVGETVKLGNSVFTVIGALQKLPGESSALSATIAPRALIPRAALEATGLAERNVLIRYRTMLKLPAERSARAGSIGTVGDGVRGLHPVHVRNSRSMHRQGRPAPALSRSGQGRQLSGSERIAGAKRSVRRSPAAALR